MPTSTRRGGAPSPPVPAAAKPAAAYHHGDLRAAILEAAKAALDARGPAGLSLREIARRLGVSHNAPSRHFASREALLAALAADGFRELARRTRAAAAAAAPDERLRATGVAYIAFALDQPATFRLMFSGLLGKDATPDLLAAAMASLGGLRAEAGRAHGAERAVEATIGAWACAHGLATLLLDGQIPAAMARGRTRLEIAADVLGGMARRAGGAG